MFSGSFESTILGKYLQKEELTEFFEVVRFVTI